MIQMYIIFAKKYLSHFSDVTKQRQVFFLKHFLNIFHSSLFFFFPYRKLKKVMYLPLTLNSYFINAFHPTIYHLSPFLPFLFHFF